MEVPEAEELPTILHSGYPSGSLLTGVMAEDILDLWNFLLPSESSSIIVCFPGISKYLHGETKAVVLGSIFKMPWRPLPLSASAVEAQGW